jgi:ribosomal protein L11 methyltransferase
MPAKLGGSYDIVLANIVADVIIALVPHVSQFLSPNGVFICSGVLDKREAEVAAAIEGAGLRIVSRDAQEDWRRFTASFK